VPADVIHLPLAEGNRKELAGGPALASRPCPERAAASAAETRQA